MSDYRTSRAGPWHDLTDNIVGGEIQFGNTVTFLSEVDLTEVEAIRKRAARTMRPTYTAFVAKAVALALREYPYANRRLYRRSWLPWGRHRIQEFGDCDLAVACERNLPGVHVATFIDIMRSADRLTLTEITEWLRNLASSDEHNNAQWRTYKWIVTNLPAWLAALIVRLPVFSPSMWAKYRGGSVIISSPAKYGIDTIVGAWTAPLGISFGYAKMRAVVREKEVVPRKTFALTLNFDRRVMAGAQAARFFKRIVELLESAASSLTEQTPAAPDAVQGNRIESRLNRCLQAVGD